ncbi:YkvA family protein [Haloimpatiens sp. FM7330]|uniref:YkvA family protein n=1 Tax=Haloimpatiens sp. FM7330 TaxID=3298610 RepID=UPI0036271826
MKISSVNIDITSQDLLSILKEVISEFVPVKGIHIRNVDIDKFITITGKYDGKIKISFKACIEVFEVENNIVKLKIRQITLGKFKIFKFIKNFTLKKALGEYRTYGISCDKDLIFVDINRLCGYIPKVQFNILSINVNKGLKVEVENVNITLRDKIEIEDEKVMDSKYELKVKKKIDSYTNFRKDMIEKVPDKYEKVAKYALIVPDIAALLFRLFKDKRVDVTKKILVGSIIGYLALPIDILPDFIPFIGKIDDVAIAFFGLNMIINDIPENVILENWQGEDNIILTVKEAVLFLTDLLGGQKVSKLFNILKNERKGVSKDGGNGEGAANI